MEKPTFRSALIVGTGPGLSASLARLFASNGLQVAVAARQTDKLAGLAKETSAAVHACNAADLKEVAGLFDALDAAGRTPDVVVYNASSRVRGPLVDLAPEDVKRAIEISAFGGFLVSQQAARRMLPKAHGAIFLTGATAGVKGFALSATFAMGTGTADSRTASSTSTRAAADKVLASDAGFVGAGTDSVIGGSSSSLKPRALRTNSS